MRYSCNIRRASDWGEGEDVDYNRVSDIARRLIAETETHPDDSVHMYVHDSANDSSKHLYYEWSTREIHIHHETHPDVHPETDTAVGHIETLREVQQLARDYLVGQSASERQAAETALWERGERDYLEDLRMWGRMLDRRDRKAYLLMFRMGLHMEKTVGGIGTIIYPLDLDEDVEQPDDALRALLKAEGPEEFARATARQMGER